MKQYLKILSIFIIFNLSNSAFSNENKINSNNEQINEQSIENNQKIWSVEDDVYKNLVNLYVREGFSIPSNAGPWSSDELKRMLNKFDGNFKDEISQKLYDKIYSKLYEKSRFSTKDEFFFNVNGIVNPEFYFHSNPQNFNKESDWNYDYEKRKNLFTFESDIWISKYIYLYTDIGLGFGGNIYNQYDYKEDDILYAPNFNSNIPYIFGNDFSVLSLNFPRRAFFSIGGNHWNLSFGRDIIRWGSGETGNLFLGGNSLYDTNLRFCFYYDAFKYSCITNFYPHNSIVLNSSQNENQSGIRFFMAHRLDFKFFRDKISLGIAEGMMYQNSTGFADLTVINPQVILHNLYIRGNANSIMYVDFDYTIIKGLNLYAQFVLDEFSFLGEPTSTSENGWRPSKFGSLLGIKYFVPVKKGLLKLSVEGVYTEPYLYLREKYNTEKGIYGVSFYGDLKEFSSYNNKELYFIRNCIGYKYGGDCITANLKAVYDSLEKWKLQAEFFYMAHGIVYQDLEQDWIYGKQSPTPSTEDKTSSTHSTGFAEHTFLFSVNSSYDISNYLNVYAGIDNYVILNKNNLKHSPVYDFQFFSGIKFKF